MADTAEKYALAVLLNHEAEPCGEYRPNFRAEWWWCPACGWESERQPYRDPGGVAIHQAQALAAAGLLVTAPTPPGSSERRG